jgi:hypothetical protein
MKAILMALLMVCSFSVVGCNDDDKPKLPSTGGIEKKAEEAKAEAEKKAADAKAAAEKKAKEAGSN